MRDKNILVVFPLLTTALNPKMGGASNRVYNLLAQLKSENNVILLEPENLKSVELKSNGIKRVTFKRLTPFFLTDFNIDFHLKLYKVLKDNKVDLIQVAYLGGAISSKIIAKLAKSNALVVYDAHNVEGERLKEALNPNLPFYKRMGAPLYIPLIEKIAVKVVDHIISVSDDDKNLFVSKHSLNPEKITVIPSGANKLEKRQLQDREKIREELGIKSYEMLVVFHGTYKNYANREAIKYIIDYIAPFFEDLDEKVKFLLAGRDIPVFERKNVKSLGFVDDIYSLLNASDIAVVPLLRGGGTKLKIFDYMSIGLPIVSTRKGIEGIEAENFKDVLLADYVDREFIDLLEYLITNEQKRERIKQNAGKLVGRVYDWKRIGETLNKLYENLI